MLRLMVHSERTYQGVCEFLNEDEWRLEIEKHVKLRYDKRKKK